MNMTKGCGKRYLATAISLALTSYVPSAYPLGLGAASVQSRIGEPLLAEIPILDGSNDYQPNEILVRQVRGKLAEQLGFELAADAPTYFLKITEQDGRLVLLVRSKRTMSEPFVSVLVELEWPSGKLYRDYNLLLDLAPLTVDVPVASGAGDSISQRDDSVLEPRPGSANASPLKPPSSFTVSTAADVERTAVTPSHSGESWRVDGGDTLSQIAQKIRPDDQIKLTAVVEALFQLNPQAFLNGDINRMQGGSLLKLPSPEAFRVMPRWDGRAGVTQTLGRAAGSPSRESTTIHQAQAEISQIGDRSRLTGSIQQQSARLNDQRQVAQEPVVSKVVGAAEGESTGLEDYIIQAGDTLSQVAQRLRRDPRVRLQDMMRLLYDSNPQAFVDGDINRLQLGASLSVPNHGNWSAPVVQPLPSIESLPRPEEPRVSDETPSRASHISPDQRAEASPNERSFHATDVIESEDPQAARLTLSSTENANLDSNDPGNSAQQILYQIDAVAELVDKVNRENQAIRQRIERIEHSEQLVLLERLLELQTRQIQNLRQAMIDQSDVSSSGESVPTMAVEGADASVTQRLGGEGLVISNEAKLLAEHLRGAGQSEEPKELVDVLADTQPASGIDSPDKVLSDKELSEPTIDQAPKGEISASLAASSIAAALLSMFGWLLIFRRRPVCRWLHKKLNLFEQNAEQASLPRVWDPELGAWRVREDIRKPVLTPLETSLDDIEAALQRHNEQQQGATGLRQSHEVKPSTLQDRLDAEEKRRQQAAETVHERPKPQGFIEEIDTQDIDSLFEELTPEDVELDEPTGASLLAEQDDFPLLNVVADKAEPSVSDTEVKSSNEFRVDNLDGEFDFSLPDEMFEHPTTEDVTSKTPFSAADARVIASIVEKTKNYDPESIDEALENWLGGSIPAPEISEYEDVISEAMIYAAYGRHEHAEQLLLEQIKLNPSEQELQAALAEVQKSASQFKSGEGFGDLNGVQEGALAPLNFPNKPDAFDGLTLDLDEGPTKSKDEG